MLRSLTRDEVRGIDRRAVEEYGLPGIVLMENAGRGTVDLLERLGVRGFVVVCAGKGNNAGDGFVIARHLENRGHCVRVLLFGEAELLRGDAATNFGVIRRAGATIREFVDTPAVDDVLQEVRGADWVVDALLGTGVKGEVREPFVPVIEAVNRSPARVLAVDLPSGLDCNTGEPLGTCVRAAHTATFVARKAGFAAPGADRWTGEVHVVDIGVPRAMLVPFEAESWS